MSTLARKLHRSWYAASTPVADVFARTEGQAAEILEGSEFDLKWREAELAVADLPRYGTVDQEKADQFAGMTAAEIAAVARTTPPLFFVRGGVIKLLDGGHRIAAAHAKGLGKITVLYANPGRGQL